jgi:diguanylate cyclase (GGDEF)-like protein
MVETADVGDIQTKAALQRLIRFDQLIALRRNTAPVVPINIVISLVTVLVAAHYGQGRIGYGWLAASVLINCIRLGQSWPWCPMATTPQSVDRQLRLLCATALISGCVWAVVPVLCSYCSSPQTVFYLTVICGVTAGAITHGTPYALMPTLYIAPPLLSVFGCLLYTGGFDHNALAATVLIYSLALIRSAWRSQADFRETSRLKNAAVTLAESLQEAHSHALVVADQMTHRAAHDGLTGLLNRSGFMQKVEALLEGEDGVFCLMLLDLDGFKSVNDVYGHHAGDRVLVEVASRLWEALDEQFVIARMGGDEYAIFYDSSKVEGFPAELALRLVTTIEMPFTACDVGRLGACIGVYTGRGRNVTEMLTYADEALYVAKTAGRNRFYIFDEMLHERLEMRRDVERDLQRALSANEIEIWYQPVFRQSSMTLVSFEALLRWRHPRHGMIPPEELIMVAAMAGHAELLLRYLCRQVCMTIVELHGLGLEEIQVAMNISPREISRLPIDEIVLNGLREFGLPAASLEIEITEESALDIRSVQDKLIRLAQAGVKITIDDFGVGYSSLATLRQSYISKIKVDHSFISGVAQSAENQILVQAILNLGRSLNVQVVAEGVENVEDLDWLGEAGGDLLQGYYLRPPGAKKALFDWLRQRDFTPLH